MKNGKYKQYYRWKECINCHDTYMETDTNWGIKVCPVCREYNDLSKASTNPKQQEAYFKEATEKVQKWLKE